MKRYIILIISILAFNLFSVNLSGQQMVSFSQYALNKYSVNPAVAGSEAFIPVNFGYKQYWTGFDNAPLLAEVNMHGAVTHRMGMGGRIFQFESGPLTKLGAEFSYAYHIPLSANGLQLGLGLSGQIYQYSLNFNKLTVENSGDPALSGTAEQLVVPDAATGLYLYSRSFYFGAAVYQLLGRTVDMMNPAVEQTQKQHLFLNTGFRHDFNQNVSIEPSVLVKLYDPYLYQAEAGFIFTVKPVCIGASYRLDDSMVILLGTRAGRISFCYSYDYILSGLADFSNGSHELHLGFRINTSKPKLMD